MDHIDKDKRFAVLKEPHFKKMPIKEQKTEIDKRFCGMFKEDSSFKLKYVMDKHGRSVNHTTSDDFKKFYKLSDSGSEEEEKLDSENKETTDEDNDVDEKNNLQNDMLSHPKRKKKMHIAQDKNLEEIQHKVKHSKMKNSTKNKVNNDDENINELKTPISESESEDSDSEDDNDLNFDHKWEELDADAPVATEITRRIAVCNMDWDRIRAEDIFAVFNSFKPPNGIIYSIKIYPSEFGLKRIEEEKLRGPLELVEQTLHSDEEENVEDKEGSRYHREKLRQYQINRLKYYYAVIECDSPETADSLYEQLNGMEYESSAVSMDLRFIPDDVTFDQEPTSIANSLPDASEYKPRLFITSALQQVKVNLTWDETDPKRREIIQKAFREKESIEKDIKNYLASSSSEESDDEVSENVANNDSDKKLKEKERRAKYKTLFEKKLEEEEDDYEIEITWEPGLKEKTEEIVKNKIEKETITPFEEKLKKKKEERKLKKKERKISQVKGTESLSYENENSDGKNNKFRNRYRKEKSTASDDDRMAELSLLVSDSVRDKEANSELLTKKKKKKWSKIKHKEIKNNDFEVNINDERFFPIYNNSVYNIDPTDPHYKETKGMQALLKEKGRKRKYEIVPNSDNITRKHSRISTDDLNKRFKRRKV